MQRLRLLMQRVQLHRDQLLRLPLALKALPKRVREHMPGGDLRVALLRGREVRAVPLELPFLRGTKHPLHRVSFRAPLLRARLSLRVSGGLLRGERDLFIMRRLLPDLRLALRLHLLRPLRDPAQCLLSLAVSH